MLAITKASTDVVSVNDPHNKQMKNISSGLGILKSGIEGATGLGTALGKEKIGENLSKVLFSSHEIHSGLNERKEAKEAAQNTQKDAAH